jgi:hypothetical protein
VDGIIAQANRQWRLFFTFILKISHNKDRINSPYIGHIMSFDDGGRYILRQE